MSSIVVAGDTSGSVTLQAPAVANSTVLTLPAVSGTVITNTAAVVTQAMLSTNVAGNGPAFSAYQSVAQTLTSSVTKIQFQTEEFDTANCFDATTNYRFTPTVAGYYQASMGVRFGNYTANNFIALYKNGSLNRYFAQTLSNGLQQSGTCLIYLNGSSDYIEIFASQAVTANLDASLSTFFQAFLARSA